MFTTSTLKRLSISHLFSNGRSTSLLHTSIWLPSDFHSRVSGSLPPPPPPAVCVYFSSLYKAKFPHQRSQISHAHPCMLWSLPQKRFSSLYLRKWTQLCKKKRNKNTKFLLSERDVSLKKINVHILVQWTCRLHTTVLKGVSPKLPHELVYLAVASGLCCTKCLFCTKTKARGLWFDFHSWFCFVFPVIFYLKIKTGKHNYFFPTVMRIKPDMDMPRKKNVRFISFRCCSGREIWPSHQILFENIKFKGG